MKPRHYSAKFWNSILRTSRQMFCSRQYRRKKPNARDVCESSSECRRRAAFGPNKITKVPSACLPLYTRSTRARKKSNGFLKQSRKTKQNYTGRTLSGGLETYWQVAATQNAEHYFLNCNVGSPMITERL